jgi:hypothetical protein
VDSYADISDGSFDTNLISRYSDVQGDIFTSNGVGSLLFIGAGDEETTNRDCILIRPSGVLILDTGDSTVATDNNDIILFPHSDAKGNVGIKTANPGYDLDVNGEIRCTGDLYVGDAIRFDSDLGGGGGPSNTGIFWNYENNFSLKTANAARLTVDDDQVDILEDLVVDGDVTADSFNATSDYRVKENVQTISGENYIVDHLRPVSYTLKDSQEPHVGFIAHELQEHVPTAVKGEKDGEEMQSVNYSELIPILVKEIQDLKKEVRELKQELKQQKS